MKMKWTVEFEPGAIALFAARVLGAATRADSRSWLFSANDDRYIPCLVTGLRKKHDIGRVDDKNFLVYLFDLVLPDGRPAAATIERCLDDDDDELWLRHCRPLEEEEDGR